jgi:hypothetical protein
MAAAGAPPLIAVSTAHGSACWTGVVDAIAAVELIIKEPATNAPTNPFNPKLAISFLRHGRMGPNHGKTTCIS